MPPERHPCPCCGFRTYGNPVGGTMQLCPVCAWEDAFGYGYNGSNESTLSQAQRHFLSHGVCEEEFLSVVRPPLPEEARSAHWASFDELCLKVIGSIEREFRKVRRDGGSTLHQMELRDGGWPILESAMKAAEAEDPETSWQELSPEKLSRFCESLCFLDNLGLRFYLPAFMRHALRTSSPDTRLADLDGVLWSLDGGPDCRFRKGSFDMLSLGQKRTVASFMFLISIYGDGCDASYASKGLRKGWNAFVPDSLKLALL